MSPATITHGAYHQYFCFLDLLEHVVLDALKNYFLVLHTTYLQLLEYRDREI